MKLSLGLAAVLICALTAPAAQAQGSGALVSSVAQLSGSANIPPISTNANGVFFTAVGSDEGSFDLRLNNIQNFTTVHLHYGGPQVADGPDILDIVPLIPFSLSISGTAEISGTFTSSNLKPPGNVELNTLTDLANLIKEGEVYINAHSELAGGKTYIRGQLSAVRSG